jgi:hypothetical protein
MTKIINLIFETSNQKEVYFEILKDNAGIPVCKSCGLLFQYAFPDSEQGICDYLICFENKILCECEYHRIVTNLYSQKSDGLIDISPYYLIKSRI